MTDAQLAVIVTAITAFGGAIAAAIRWAVNRLVKSLDDTSARAVIAQDRATEAIIDNTASNAVLVSKVDDLSARLVEVGSYVKRQTPQPQVQVSRAPTKQRGGTSPVGVRILRSTTNHDDE